MSETTIQDPERLDLPSASQMAIVVECPGMNNLKRTIPAAQLSETKDPDEQEWAKRGDRIHEAFQTGQNYLLNSEELATYNVGKHHEQMILQKWIADKALDPAKVEEGPRELRVWLYKPYNFPELMGSAMTDKHYIYRDSDRTCLLVLDLKSGWNPNLPPPARSWQLKYELISLWKEEYDNVTDGRVAYVKPKTRLDVTDYCDYEIQDLKYSFDAIAYHSWQATQPDAPRRAGLHCSWCPCKAWCPEALAYALLPSTIAKVFTSKKVPERVNDITGDDLYRIWEAGPVIKKIIDSVVARLKSFTTDELFLIGLEKGKGRETHEIVKLKEAFEFLRDKQGWSEEHLWNALSFVNGKLADVAGRLYGLTEEEATDWVKKTLAEFIEIKVSDRPLKKRQ
jgi:hypothetical protein